MDTEPHITRSSADPERIAVARVLLYVYAVFSTGLLAVYVVVGKPAQMILLTAASYVIAVVVAVIAVAFEAGTKWQSEQLPRLALYIYAGIYVLGCMQQNIEPDIAFWNLLYPPIFYYLAGLRLGTKVCAAMLAYSVLFRIGYMQFDTPPLPTPLFAQMAIGYISVALIAYRYELIRTRQTEALVREGRQLEKLVADLTDKERELQHLAHHDALTGLPNRLLFRDRLEHAVRQAQRRGLSVGLLYLDLDGFKAVNDALGHHAGDLLLKSVAGRLTTCLREEDTIARMGGDEFTVLLPLLQNTEDASQVAEKILHALSEPFMLDEHAARISASIGISFYPRHGEDVDQLLKSADTAMYRTKTSGKNAFQLAPAGS